MKRTGITLALAGSLLLPVAALAQGHQGGGAEQANAASMSGMNRKELPQGRMMRMMEQQGRMMKMATGPSITMILAQKEVLDLSEEQVNRLEDLQTGEKKALETDAAELQSLAGSLARVMDQAGGKPDLKKYESLLRAKANREVDVKLRSARLGQSALSVLTEAQRAKLRTGMQVMRAMMKSMHKGMMGGVMMQGSGARNGMAVAGPGPEQDAASSGTL